MADALVSRLRGFVSVPQIGGPDMLVQGIEVCAEAAAEIERLKVMCEQFASCAKSFGTKYGSDVVEFRINEKKFRKTWEKYKGGAW